MSRQKIVYLGLIVIGAILLLAAAILIFPAASSPTSTNAAVTQTGDQMEFVGQITAIQGTVLTVEILEGTGTDNVFNIRTGQFIEVVQTAAPEIVMGTSADIFVGAIGQFRGTKTGDNQIQLSRIVILTGYVTGPTP
jgi:hypothetical protein